MTERVRPIAMMIAGVAADNVRYRTDSSGGLSDDVKETFLCGRLTQCVHSKSERPSRLRNSVQDAQHPSSIGNAALPTAAFSTNSVDGVGLDDPAQERHVTNHGVSATAILDSLTAPVALIDQSGLIVSINDAWQQFTDGNASPGHASNIGQNYLEVCDRATGDGASEAHAAAAGIRSVLRTPGQRFSMEYPCHSLLEKRWFLMTAASVISEFFAGVVVLHVNITERVKSQQRIGRLNRIHSVLSGISSLIVRSQHRGELLKGGCKLAVELGGFRLAWIGMIDRTLMTIVPVECAGADFRALTGRTDGFSYRDDGPFRDTLFVRAFTSMIPVVSNDIRLEPGILFPNELATLGIASAAMLPLVADGMVIGVLTLYADQVNWFDTEEVDLLTQLAADLGLALDYIEKNRRLKYLAYYDSLTGLGNRALFIERVSAAATSASQEGRRIAVGLIDIERFRNFNGSLGRPSGDALLKLIADWLTTYVGGSHRVARVGIDLFALHLDVTGGDIDVTRFFSTQIASFLSHPFRLDDAVFRIAMKAGVAVLPDHGRDAESLLKNAELALKKAKQGSRRYEMFSQQMADVVAGRHALENQLRQALEKGEFVLYYQPKVTVADGAIVGAEALLRWNDPRTGIVSPGVFIPILEETGLIHEVGSWAIRQAIQDGQRWRRAGLKDLRIAVNVSPIQLRNREFINEIQLAIDGDHDVAQGLELEVTESTLMEDVKYSIATLKAIQNMGVDVVLDDFGTGFSSLSHLSELPINTLKIDRSFILKMKEPEGQALVAAIITLAHALQLRVVAEGVETDEQLQVLAGLKCDEFQGFLTSEPIPRDLFEVRFLSAISA